MRLHCGGYINVLWVVILCLVMQCVVSRDNTAIKENTGVENNEPATQQNKPAKTPAAQNLPNKSAVSKTQSALSPLNKGTTDTGNVTSISGVPRPLNSSQETVQPSRKNISTGAFVRAFYVFVGLCAIVVMYIVVRTVRLRRKKATVRKYGILTSREDVEMTPLGAEDEEEDATLFDMTLHKSRP